MKLTIFTAAGGVGRQLLEQGVAAGHDVPAVARNPGKLTRQVRTVIVGLAADRPRKLRPLVPVHTLGQAARAIRDGGNLAPDRAVGKRTWEEFLSDRI
jgi:putative NADH-flavin reductase